MEKIQSRRFTEEFHRTHSVFLIEVNNVPIGECWLQKMNLPDALSMYDATTDVRRIDMSVGEKQYWNQGITYIKNRSTSLSKSNFTKSPYSKEYSVPNNDIEATSSTATGTLKVNIIVKPSPPPKLLFSN